MNVASRQQVGMPSPNAPIGGSPSPRSLRGLDWFIFFLADVQTGFGPFVAVYLTTEKWTQVEIGIVLSVSGFVALLGQMPGGAIVDWSRSERLVAGLAVAAIGASATAYALWPIFPVVLAAAILHAAGSCVLGPAIAAISLGLVGRRTVGQRFGRNARFASLGNGFAAAAMGTCGYFISSSSVFFVTAALVVPTLLALSRIRADDINPEIAHGELPHDKSTPATRQSIATLVRNRTLLLFAACLMMFHLANAAMLPTMGSVLTTQSSNWAPALIGACIVIPQIVVALISLRVGSRADAWGRRPLLLIGFAALVARALLFSVVREPALIVVIQILDGIAAAALGVLVPLIIADLTFGTGHFNLAQGIVGTAVGIGASISTLFAGYISDHFNSGITFASLAAAAALALTLVYSLMPETKFNDASKP
jgi:MFS family permease